MKRILLIFTLCVLLLCSCAKNKVTIEYKTDVDVNSIASKVIEENELTTLTKADEGWVALNIPVDTSLCESSVVYISITGESNLFGIFKATSEENANKLNEMANKYLDNLEANWMSEYAPEELPKVQNAITMKCGNYVSFIILEDELRDNAQSIITEMLEK